MPHSRKFEQFTEWLPRGDPALKTWQEHFEKHGIATYIRTRRIRHGTIVRAVFRESTNKPVAKVSNGA